MTATACDAIKRLAAMDVIGNDGVIAGDVRSGGAIDRFVSGTGTSDGAVFGEDGSGTAVVSQAAPSGTLKVDCGAHDAGGDTLDLSGFATAVWVDFPRGNASDNSFGHVGAQRLPGIETMSGRDGTDKVDLSRSEGAVWVDLNFGSTAVRAEA